MQTPFDPTQSGLADKTAAGIDRLSSGAHHAVEKTAAGIDRLSSGAHEAADRASARIDRMSSGAQHAVERVADAASTAARTISRRGSELRARQSQMTESARDCVRRHPIASVGIAVGVGLLLSLFSGHGRSSDDQTRH